mgnify:CR=1 FL=1
MPEGLDELLLGGFLSQPPHRDWSSAVTVDLEVPASAHIVLEGYVEPGERRREGPFGDHTGFYSQPDDYPVFHLTCITHAQAADLSDDRSSASRRWRTTISGMASERIFPADDSEDRARKSWTCTFPRKASSTTS